MKLSTSKDKSVKGAQYGDSTSPSLKKFGIVDRRLETSVQKQHLDEASSSVRAVVQRSMFDDATKKETRHTFSSNDTGMPDKLKNGLESLSGFDLSSVRVHYNSDKPATVGAVAYAQGNQIHLARGQEKHLPHEGWHVVQQMQGRVRPEAMCGDNTFLNSNGDLEHEADRMGNLAMVETAAQDGTTNLKAPALAGGIIQRKIEGIKEFEEGFLKISFDTTENGKEVGEEGTIEFIPKVFGRELKSIYFEQSVKNSRYIKSTEETTPEDETLAAMAVTEGPFKGFFSDNVPSGLSLKKQNRKPVYDNSFQQKKLHYYINAGVEDESSYNNDKSEKNTVGKRITNGETPVIAAARLTDTPKFDMPMKFDFLTSAIDHETQIYLGHVHWGFEIFAKDGTANGIRGEYCEFLQPNNKKAMDLQVITTGKFYEVLKNGITPSVALSPDIEEMYERKVHDIFRMSEFRKEYTLSLDEFVELVKKAIPQSTWRDIYDYICRDLFPKARPY